MTIPLTLLLCRESGGMAVPLARVKDRAVLRVVQNAAIRAKRLEAEQTSDVFSRRRLELEAEELEQAR
jgi:hypothetical protein